MATPTPCYHCGLPVPAGSTWHAEVLGENRPLCCPGCQAVAEAIVAGGLEHYYKHRSETAANPQDLPQILPDELALYDRAEVQQPFVQHQGELSETCLLIEGISCAACGWLIEKHLREGLFMSLGEISVFYTSPIAIVIWALVIVVLLLEPLRQLAARMLGIKIKKIIPESSE